MIGSVVPGVAEMDYMSLPSAPKFAPSLYGWPSGSLRQTFGENRKSLFHKYKLFIHKHVHAMASD
jgi:hypothetical protein